MYKGNSTIADVTFRLSFETLIWHRQRINKELSSFPLMNMFVPTDILIGLYNFSISLISVKEIEPKNTVADITEKSTTLSSALALSQNSCEVSGFLI